MFWNLSEQLDFGCMLTKEHEILLCSLRLSFLIAGTDGFFYHFQFGLSLQTDFLTIKNKIRTRSALQFSIFLNQKDWTITVLKERTPSSQHILFYTIQKKCTCFFEMIRGMLTMSCHEQWFNCYQLLGTYIYIYIYLHDVSMIYQRYKILTTYWLK